MSHSLINQSHLIANIDRLVRDTIFSPVNFDDIKNRLNALYFPFMETLNPDLFYSQTIDSFVYSTDAIVGDLYPSDVIWDHGKTQQFVNNIACYKQDIETEDNAWRYQESQNRQNFESYVRSLLSHYSRLLFVRIDLKYSQESSHTVTIEDFNHHMSKLRELIGNKKTCFEHLQGNAWALEQGYENGGLHCHLLLIYDGSERQSDWHIAKEVGEKWKEITAGLGKYYSYHDPERKQRYERYGKLGIGMIHRDNSQQVENAICTALYLTKPDKVGQHLKVWLPSMRTFGHGIYRTAKRRGLPPITN
ncbi:YagK/YfjJ domain-containing protein [Psychrobacter jeotgali]|uniref:YagK/YfjJ domain-containing protein n=1 Tax=Psychrobacter jeotgali TaxID=179010 RepID=UPI001917C79F|nr:inovirus-type Gp2 protein [Psychrobacter jeotgali]